jgi:putative endonuclease
MRYVYLLRSVGSPGQTYIGRTCDVDQRLKEHNQGKSPHTAKFVPWELVAFIGFADAASAGLFEEYLKTGSGRAFAKRHFLL